MTTAHRPTFDTARGKSSQAPTRIYHSRMLPAHTQLKFRKRGQGGAADRADLATLPASEERQWEREAMKKELLAKEAESNKKKGRAQDPVNDVLLLEAGASEGEDSDGGAESDEEERKLKRRRMILEEAKKNEEASDEEGAKSDVSGSDEGSDSESGSDEEDEEEEEDETAELMRELERIKKERAAEKERQERERQETEQAERQKEIAKGNPLLAFNDGFLSSSKPSKRWDEDVVFKNQAKGIDGKHSSEFINDMLRSDFHKKFMNKYIR